MCEDGDAARKQARRKANWKARAALVPKQAAGSAEHPVATPHALPAHDTPSSQPSVTTSDPEEGLGDWSSASSLASGSPGAGGNAPDHKLVRAARRWRHSQHYKPQHRFNTGYFLKQAAEAGIDPVQLVQHLDTLLRSGDDATLLRFSSGPGPGRSLPVRLVEPIAAWLGPLQLQRQLGAVNGLRSRQELALPSLRFDAVHLTYAGFAATLCALHWDDEVAVCPAGYAAVQSVPGGAQQSASGDDEPAGTVAECAGMQTVPLEVLFGRWPHLPSVLSSADAEVVADAEGFLAALGRGELAPVPWSVTSRFHEHVRCLHFPVFSHCLEPDGLSSYFHSVSEKALDLFGAQHWPSMDAKRSVAEEAARQFMPPAVAMMQDGQKFLHPDALLPRCLALLAAQNMGLSAFQFEGLFLRALPPTPADSGHQPSVSFYGVETQFLERYRDGSPLAVTHYFSDVMFARQLPPVPSSQHMERVVGVLEALSVPSSDTPLHMHLAVRRTGKHPLRVLKDLSIDKHARAMFAGLSTFVLEPAMRLKGDSALKRHLDSSQPPPGCPADPTRRNIALRLMGVVQGVQESLPPSELEWLQADMQDWRRRPSKPAVFCMGPSRVRDDAPIMEVLPEGSDITMGACCPSLEASARPASESGASSHATAPA